MKEKMRCFLSILKARFSGSEISNMSVLIAFYLLLSIFPLLIAVGNILPFLNVDPATVIDYIDTIVPAGVQQVLDPVIETLLTTKSGGLLSIGLIAGIWSASRGVSYLRSGLNKAYGISATESFITKRLLSVFTVMLILALASVFVLAFGFGQSILEWLAPVWPWAASLAKTVGDLKWPVALVFLFCLFTLVYRVTPDVKLRIRDALPGAALATVGVLLLVQGFSLYLRFATRTFSAYGTLSAFFVLMFWLDFTVMIVLAGAVLNASIGEYRFGVAQEETSKVDLVVRKTQTSLVQRAKLLFKGRKGHSAKKGTKQSGRKAKHRQTDTKDTTPGATQDTKQEERKTKHESGRNFPRP